MATLLNLQTNQKYLLQSHHSFGRLKSSVNTFIPDPYISKVHTFIEWNGQYWLMRDVSTNGTWLNGNKLSKEKSVILHAGDIISLASKTGTSFKVTDVNPPCDLLVPIDHEDDAIELQYFHLISNQGAPKVVLSFNNQTYTWWQEVLTEDLTESHEAFELDDREYLHVGGQTWQLQVNRTIDDTCLLRPSVSSLDELTFQFQTSLDEETTQVTLTNSEQSIDLLIRSHHYLTLSLARKRAFDIKLNVEESEQGWVYAECLAKELGLGASHLNIQIYRIRKQFIDALNNACDSADIIERKGGKLRLASKNFRISKGDTLEFDAEQYQGFATEFS